MASVTIDRRFNGPPDSGNGGYSCGVVANAIEGPALVTLRKPPPLNHSLELTQNPDGRVVLLDGETLIAEAIAETFNVEVPEPPSLEEAAEVSKGYIGFDIHTFPTCFVCGPGRPDNDGMNIFPGLIEERGVVASPWSPDDSMPSADGRVNDEITWAALDCTSYFPHSGSVALLGRLQAQVMEKPRIGERYIAVGWATGGEGRKLWSESAVFDEDGNVCAVGSATWIVLKN